MDAFIFQKINALALRSLWADSLGIFFADPFSYIVGASLIIFLVWNIKKYWPMVVLALISGSLAKGITEIIRLFWGRPRPFVENNVNLLIDNINSKSFPSGHASFFFGLSAVVYFFNKKLGLVFFAASCLISIARVYCGIHWPFDIVAGFFVGIISAFIVIKVYKKIIANRSLICRPF